MVRKLVSFDWAMKKLLRSKANFDILEGFLSELLKEQIIILEVLESEANKQYHRDKFNRLDLKVKNDKGEIIIIEIQYDRENDYLQRILYGTSKVITEHMLESVAYEHITKVISVNILYFDLGVGEDYVYKGQTRFTGIHKHDELRLSEKQAQLYGSQSIAKLFPEYYLIKVNNFNDIAKSPLDEWIYFLKNEEIEKNFQAKGLEKAKDELDVLKLSDKERKQYLSFQDDIRYQLSMVNSHYREGKMDGHKEGLEKGHKEGLEKGHKEGLETGANKKAIEVAKKLKNSGVDIKVIALSTGLSVAKIKNL